MKNFRLSIMLAALIAVFGLALDGSSRKAEGGVNMKEGKWKITSTFEMKGMPDGMMRPQTFTSCLNQKDSVPKNPDQKDCTVKNLSVKGNTVTWEVQCKDSSGKGTITYAGDSYDGVLDLAMKEGGSSMNMKMNMKGKYIGPCDK